MSINVVAEVPNPRHKKIKKITFRKLEKNSFHQDAKKRVDQYFRSNNISRNWNSEMAFKTVLILAVWIATYLLILSNVLNPWVMLVLAMIHGFSHAMIGLNIAHDAIHGSYTKSKKWNKRIALLFNIVGANDYVWSITHNVVHHTYTNIPDHDLDVQQVPVMRMVPTQDRWWIHRFQHIYAPLLYCFSSLSWVFVKDYRKFFQRTYAGHHREKIPTREILRLFFYKGLYYTIFLVVPMIVIELPWYFILTGFVAAHFVEGFTMAIIFMLAHVIEGTDYPDPGAEGKIDKPWAESQMSTTSNFAAGSRLMNFLSGGLNCQIEHHLFPNICHVHYRRISDIIRQTANDHDVPYLEYRTFGGAVAAHLRLLKKFGREDKRVSS